MVYEFTSLTIIQPMVLESQDTVGVRTQRIRRAGKKRMIRMRLMRRRKGKTRREKEKKNCEDPSIWKVRGAKGFLIIQPRVKAHFDFAENVSHFLRLTDLPRWLTENGMRALSFRWHMNAHAHSSPPLPFRFSQLALQPPFVTYTNIRVHKHKIFLSALLYTHL